MTFAIRDDDTGNQCIQGHIEPPSRCCEGSSVRKLIGASFSNTCRKACNMLAEIVLNKLFREFGVLGDQTKGFRDHLVEFKSAVQIGSKQEQLLNWFPRLCAEHSLQVVKHLDNNPPPPPPEGITECEWASIGGPRQLPWKVHQAWKKGHTHEASPEEKVNSSNVFTGKCGSPSWKVCKA
jgi:hypothetical protein